MNKNLNIFLFKFFKKMIRIFFKNKVGIEFGPRTISGGKIEILEVNHTLKEDLEENKVLKEDLEKNEVTKKIQILKEELVDSQALKEDLEDNFDKENEKDSQDAVQPKQNN